MTVPICTLATSLGIASLFAGSLIGGTTALHAAPGDKIGSAVSIINTVTVALAKEKRGLATGDSVRQNELVEVSADSLGEFRLDDDTKLALGPGARLRLDKFVYDPDKKVGTIIVNLVKGTFRFMTGTAAKPTYVIRTPTAAITVRGTIFDAFIQPDNSTWLLLHEGAIEVRGARNVCRVLDRPGHLMRISSNGSVGVPVNWQRLPGRAIGLDAAFPFVTRPPLVDPTPKLTRGAILNAAQVRSRAPACRSASPTVPGTRGAVPPPPPPRKGLRRASLDRDVEVIRIRPVRVVERKRPPRGPQYPPRRPGGLSGLPIGIAIGIGGFRPGNRGIGPRGPIRGGQRSFGR